MLVYIIIQCMYTRMLYTVLLDLCTDMAIYSTAVADMNTRRQLRFVRPCKEQKSLKVKDDKSAALVKHYY